MGITFKPTVLNCRLLRRVRLDMVEIARAAFEQMPATAAGQLPIGRSIRSNFGDADEMTSRQAQPVMNL